MAIDPRAKEAAPFILLDWKMFTSAAKMLKILSTDSDPRRQTFLSVMHERYAEVVFLESFLFHARNLCDFLYRENFGDSDDVVARHYFEDELSWNKTDLDAGHYIADNKVRLYQVLARLRYNRAEFGKLELKNWDVPLMETEITKAWRAFIDALPAERQAWFEVPIPSKAQSRAAG